MSRGKFSEVRQENELLKNGGLRVASTEVGRRCESVACGWCCIDDEGVAWCQEVGAARRRSKAWRGVRWSRVVRGRPPVAGVIGQHLDFGAQGPVFAGAPQAVTGIGIA